MRPHHDGSPLYVSDPAPAPGPRTLYGGAGALYTGSDGSTTIDGYGPGVQVRAMAS
jgi:hypothetical protein